MHKRRNCSQGVNSLLRGSFVNHNLLRKYPYLSSFHRAVDGALFGVIVSAAVMTSLALHSQHLWTLNFSRLKMTTNLNHNLEESIALLEKYFLKSVNSPSSMVATKSTHLIYLDRPRSIKPSLTNVIETLQDRMSPILHPISNGY